MSITQLFLAALLFAPAAGEAEPPASDYAATIEEIATLSERMNFGDPVAEDLVKALAELPNYTPRLAADPEALQLRTRAQLQVARAALSNGDMETATWMVDEAIRSAMGTEVSLDEFGPSLAELYGQRRDALASAGKASIEIECTRPCRVFVDEHLTDASITDLPLGVYRLWVEGTQDAGLSQVLEEVVVLETEGQVATRVFGPSKSIVAEQPKPVAKRLMPREAEAFLIAAGIGVMTAGALMMGIRPDRPNLIAGGTMVGVGGVMLISGSVTLGIDEVRMGEQRGRRAMVTWTFRF